MNKTKQDLQKLLDVNWPIIYINDYDFVRVDALLSSVCKGGKIFEWNPASGTTHFVSKNSQGMGDDDTLVNFLSMKYLEDIESDHPIPKFLVLKESHDLFNEPEVKALLSLIAQRKLYDPTFDTTVIIVSSIRKIPDELNKYVSYLDMEYPSEDEIMELIEEHIEVNKYDRNKFTDKDKDMLMPSLKGLSAFEIDRMLDMAMSSNGSLSAEDREMILRQKKQMVKNSGVLELIDTPERIEKIGGLTALKDYLKRKSTIYHRLPEAYNRHVSIPKGVFIVGMPGCGKSLCAKAAASLFEVPLLKLDMGSMMGKYVGQSEENLRKAIKIAEAASPCIIWIDEIEKAFSGVGGHNDILTRMFGYFLSWMQEKTRPVYVVATANNAENLPPELKRKGRFDEIFCVNLPTAEERESIFKVHLDRVKCDIGESAIKALASDNITKGFNGADIEAIVNAAVEENFINQKLLTGELFESIAKETVSISKSCSAQIDKMKKLFEENSFKDAFTGKIVSGKK